MAHKCPNCSNDVPGVVPQTTLEQRLEAKNAEIGLLRDELAKSTDKATRFDGVEAERARLAGELVELREGTTRREALLELGVADSNVAASFSALYSSATAHLEADARPSFAAWLDDENGARANPLLVGFFAAGNDGATPAAPSHLPTNGATSAASATATSRPPASSFPAPGRATDPNPPASTPRLSPGQLRRMFQTMSPAEVRAWQEQNGSAHGWQAASSSSS
jgi:hypothetical protein